MGELMHSTTVSYIVLSIWILKNGFFDSFHNEFYEKLEEVL